MKYCTTIGIDLGDKKHAVVGLDEKAKIILKRWLPNNREDLERLPDGFALHVPRAPEVRRDVSASAFAFVMPPCQLDDGAADMEVIVMDAVVLARNDLDFGPCDGFYELGLKAPDSVGITYR